jgi:hypothetical protein
MNKLKINREELLSLYLKQVDDICEECDWKTSFGPKEIVTIIVKLLEDNANLIEHEISNTDIEHIIQSVHQKIDEAYSAGYEAGLDAAYISNQG